MYKRISKLGYIAQSVNEDIFIKNLQEGTFAFAHLFLQISDSHIPYEVFWVDRNKANKWLEKQVLLLFRCHTNNSPIRA